MTHTQGAWFTKEFQGVLEVWYTGENGRDYQLAQVFRDNRPESQAANATLIAASPDLLESLILALPFVEGKNDYVEGLMKLVITKARGQS